MNANETESAVQVAATIPEYKDKALLYEALRYLGYRELKREADPQTNAVLVRVLEELRATITPRHVYAVWDCRIDSDIVELDCLRIKSRKLAQHMAGCDKAILLAATLGTQADTLMRRYDVTDMQAAVVAQAVGAALIEEYLDRVEASMLAAEGLDAPGMRHAARFSPGYGDFDIGHQAAILHLLDAGRRIGLTLTSAGMLVPTKSVTAIIGVASKAGER